MMPEPVLHPHTKEHVAQCIASPSHALLLAGTNGVGKTYLARMIVAGVLGIEPARLDDYPYFKLVSPVKGSISIDAVRDLQRFLQLKTLGDRPLRRAVIIEHAEGLTVEAQNAFLKVLEEPPADTIVLLTADNQRTLLTTILSRVQLVPVYAPSEEALRQAFGPLAQDEAALNQAFFLSGGLPGLMTALLSGDETHPLLAGVADAKLILQKQTFERLAMVESMSKQKEEAAYILQALQHVAQTGLEQAAKKGDVARVKQWYRVLKHATEAMDGLSKNANAKLVLTNLMLAI